MDIRSWLVHTCTKKSRTGAGAKGDATYGTPTTFKARVEKSRAGTRSAQGKETEHEFVLLTNIEILIDDVIWFPSIAGEEADDLDDINDARTPINVEVVTDKAGITKVWQVYFGA